MLKQDHPIPVISNALLTLNSVVFNNLNIITILSCTIYLHYRHYEFLYEVKEKIVVI